MLLNLYTLTMWSAVSTDARRVLGEKSDNSEVPYYRKNNRVPAGPAGKWINHSKVESREQLRIWT